MLSFILLLVLVSILWLVLISPSLYSRGKEPVRERPPRPKRDIRPTPEGLRSKEEINRMLAEEIRELKAINVPISDSIAPVVLFGAWHGHYGECRHKGFQGIETGYDHLIALSAYTLANSEKSIRNTIIHELIHTVPGGDSHRGKWKKWAIYASEKLGYRIQGCDGDVTEEDIKNLREGFKLPKGLVTKRKRGND